MGAIIAAIFLAYVGVYGGEAIVKEAHQSWQGLKERTRRQGHPLARGLVNGVAGAGWVAATAGRGVATAAREDAAMVRRRVSPEGRDEVAARRVARREAHDQRREAARARRAERYDQRHATTDLAPGAPESPVVQPLDVGADDRHEENGVVRRPLDGDTATDPRATIESDVVHDGDGSYTGRCPIDPPCPHPLKAHCRVRTIRDGGRGAQWTQCQQCACHSPSVAIVPADPTPAGQPGAEPTPTTSAGTPPTSDPAGDPPAEHDDTNGDDMPNATGDAQTYAALHEQLGALAADGDRAATDLLGLAQAAERLDVLARDEGLDPATRTAYNQVSGTCMDAAAAVGHIRVAARNAQRTLDQQQGDIAQAHQEQPHAARKTFYTGVA